MKKQLIGALVGGLILFFWQFISFGPGNLHGSQMDYMPAQEAILKALAENNVAEGEYFLPRTPMDANSEAQQKYAEERQIGRPWAQVSYHHQMENTFGFNLLRGFVIDFLSVFFLIWILMQMRDLNRKTALLTSLAVGLILSLIHISEPTRPY